MSMLASARPPVTGVAMSGASVVQRRHVMGECLEVVAIGCNGIEHHVRGMQCVRTEGWA
jgi:hypothetical protein